jgi:hypothetical protein
VPLLLATTHTTKERAAKICLQLKKHIAMSVPAKFVARVLSASLFLIQRVLFCCLCRVPVGIELHSNSTKLRRTDPKVTSARLTLIIQASQDHLARTFQQAAQRPPDRDSGLVST